MNSKRISVIVVIVLVAGGLLFFKNKGVAPIEIETDLNMPVPESNVDEMIVVKEFSIDAAPFSFTPSTMTVNKGDTAKITLKNTKGIHDLKIDEFNATTRTLNAGEEQTITFVADKSGVFQYYCSVGNHRAMGMIGTLTVK